MRGGEGRWVGARLSARTSTPVETLLSCAGSAVRSVGIYLLQLTLAGGNERKPDMDEVLFSADRFRHRAIDQRPLISRRRTR